MSAQMGKLKVGVARFPGTNCDRDVFSWVEAKGFQAEWLWHLDQYDLSQHHAVLLPGGFSYGDYLRSGALAAKSPVMNSIRDYAQKGGRVLGICNGFQILTEARLLPGALVRNVGLRFRDDWVDLKVENKKTTWSAGIETSEVRLPIAHGDGRFYASFEDLKRIEDQGQVWLRYKKNPNGSLNDIAGVTNQAGNVAALMPHPERAIYQWMGGQDGWSFL